MGRHRESAVLGGSRGEHAEHRRVTEFARSRDEYCGHLDRLPSPALQLPGGFVLPTP